ncbi:hypothetical protein [Mycobacterium gordonae]|uniref:Uncharacterized protein n=1 Tax=Mycobacterium gordonae TaxID=1778 RepID=A0A1X1W1Z8_MYCGO|nr:hypothetical protein [Mycobacterium gordonae]MCV7007437.1 hypothetical protein [Mycobacterium gordonae]ODR16916.1 hypothetical protein BHQ23_28215 [Mycobacterium gordonae]ORV80212.1 hypothetical protein AWC08_30345 [Mycobacterium gordonae]
MTENDPVDFIHDPDLSIRDLSYSRSRTRQLLDLTKGSFFDMGFGPREDDVATPEDLDSDEDWPSDRLETYVKEKPRGPGYVCDVVYHSEQLPVTVYAVLVNRGQGLEVAELELFRPDWGYTDGFDHYVPPETPEQFDSKDPPALITSDVLRRIPIGEILARTQRRLADESWRTEGVQLIPPPGEAGRNMAADELTEEQRRALEKSSAIGARRRGRPELSDELLIEVAEAYIWEAGRGRGSLNRMAEIFDRPEATIRDWIALARRRGYLAPTKSGRRGAAPGPNLPTNAKDTETADHEGGFKANLSLERRRHIMRMIEGEGVLDADLTEDARLLYVVGGLVCNDVGFVRQSDLEAAMGDPAVVAAAMEILNKAHRRAAARNASGKQKKQRRRR